MLNFDHSLLADLAPATSVLSTFGETYAQRDHDDEKVQWPPYTDEAGSIFDLSHLRPRQLVFERENPAERFTVAVRFTSHCFTQGAKPEEGPVYPLDPERIFNVRRYELSKALPAIVEGFADRKVYTNGLQGKFFSVSLVTETGEQVEYEVYFKLKKTGRGEPLELIIESAFVRDGEHPGNRPKGKPVRFWIVLHNTLHGKIIRF